MVACTTPLVISRFFFWEKENQNLHDFFLDLLRAVMAKRLIISININNIKMYFKDHILEQ